MATIVDVAQLAGVSHGTVSNVIRGSKSVKLENVLRVKAAMRELGYRPDQSAQTLKSRSTSNVSIILPNIQEPLNTGFFTSASEALNAMGYNVSLYVTDGIAQKEREVIRKEISSKSAGLIILTCQPMNTEFFGSVLESGIKVVFLEREIQGLKCSTVFCENRDSVYQTVISLSKRGYKRIGLILGPESYSSEQLCEQGYRDAVAELGLEVDPTLIGHTTNSSVSAFNTAMHLLPSRPDAIACSSTCLANGVLEALKLGADEPLPKVVSLSEEGWADNRYPNLDVIPRNSLELGIRSAELLDLAISNGLFSEIQRVSIPNNPIKIAEPTDKTRPIDGAPTLRIAAIEGDTSDSLRALMPDFTHRTGSKAVIDSFSQEELYEFIRTESNRDLYDVFAVDVLWFHEFASRGMLRNLQDELPFSALEELGIQAELLDDFSYWNGNIYGIPLMYCSQMLFYRSDLFENTTYQRMFYEQHNQPLRVPQNWTEFNAVARFFTREFNPDSPTIYGTTLGGEYSCAALCEFLPRLWACGGDVYDKNCNVTIDSFEAQEALEMYCKSFQYASPNSTEHWWDEQVEEFIAGNTAMMIMYSSYVSSMADPNRSAILGKYGFTEIPGRCPVLGGWSLAINAKSRHPQESLAFIKWACGQEMSIPNTVLGNLSASHSVFESSEIFMLYPWVRESLRILPTCRRRKLPDNKKNASIQRYEQIIARAVHDSITGKTEMGDALSQAASLLKEL